MVYGMDGIFHFIWKYTTIFTIYQARTHETAGSEDFRQVKGNELPAVCFRGRDTVGVTAPSVKCKLKASKTAPRKNPSLLLTFHHR